ncbi:unnamed protein product [Euphydryas editha]|uniref:Reverse transcriptase domain-containing protein n=1 Tax=Euphydryas editha TaxID=104508 RepID=A0AAU9UJF6_EUPED|nr:unnamed protein product [Euphydryas editha]
MAQWQINLAVVCEPYWVPAQPHWLGDLDGTVAIVKGNTTGPSLSLVERGSGYVVAACGEYVLVGTYFSPNRSLAEFEIFLDDVRAAVCRQSPRAVIVLGDFNAKSRAWGNPTTDARGRAVQAWALLSGLSLLNRGNANTCVRLSGGSVVDLSFASPAVARGVTDWRVEEEVETLSDHNYIRFAVSSPSSAADPPRGPSKFPRWALSQLDVELAREAAIVQRWASQGEDGEGTSVEELAGRFRRSLTDVCDAAMPRARRCPRQRRAVYWWSSEIADLRAASMRARRLYVRCRRRNGVDPALETELQNAYRQAKKTLQLAISRAKDVGREELLAGLNRDPWGRPYRVARNKLRGRGAPVTETMPPDLLERTVSALFPHRPAHVPPAMASSSSNELEASIPLISEAEMDVALVRLRARRTAPGPDGVPGRVLSIALEYLRGRLRALFDKCLSTGQFPKPWKTGRLCLLRKEGRPSDSPSAYRPIVLLDETAKMFEKILASRLVQHLEEAGPGLSEAQFGFRAGRSTLDALNALRALSAEAVASGDVLLATSLDIANAFNSLPVETIAEALKYHRVPHYLRRLLETYLRDREVLWEGGDGRLYRRRVGCGVPQGSVLGPTLWNVGFDWLLRASLPPGLSVICYADDTLITARGKNFEEAARLAQVGAAIAVDRIELLGLRVSVSKTEALLFHGPRRGPPRGARIVVQGTEVVIRPHMKYLGLTLDGRWSFGPHFAQLAPRLENAAAALGRLLPNVGGPGSPCRRLYAGVVRSMALYGAPVWVDALTARNKILLRRPQRIIAVRAVRGYRTVSWTAATLLAGDPPWELQAEVLAEVYRYRSSLRARGQVPSADQTGKIRALAQRALIDRWQVDLGSPVAGSVTVDAIRPHLKRWVERRHGVLTFRLTQVLTGHGCFGKYLHQIPRREATPSCHECGAPIDSVCHTLEECAAWGPQRHDLVAEIGGDLSLSTVVRRMLDNERCWSAVASFCENVMSLKEAAERAREANAHADSIRRRRPGGRRRRYALVPPPP